jgi:uncharacterized damage-inducible protein DinB
MPISELLVQEFDHEMANTRKTLERVPEEKWNWKPQEKSGTLGWLSGHIATLPGFGIVVVKTPSLEIGGANFPRVEKHALLVDTFDKMAQDARAAISGVTDEELRQPWTLAAQGKTIFTLPRYHALRAMCFNHIIHHRAQLTMYFRQLGVPVPALYGPSADESVF